MSVEVNEAAAGVGGGGGADIVQSEEGVVEVEGVTAIDFVNFRSVEASAGAITVTAHERHEDTPRPTGARAWATIYTAQVNFLDVPGSFVRLIGTARHLHHGTPVFTNGKVRLSVNGSVVYTSGTVGTGANNATGATVDSGLTSYTKPGGVATVLIEGEVEKDGEDTSQVVLANWNAIFKLSS